MTNCDTVLREETSYDYNFQDADWNNFGSARKSQELITDLTAPDDPTDPLYDASKIEALDRANTGTSFVVRKDDVSSEEWAALNPNDQSGTIVWDDIVEVEIGTNEWASFANFERDENGTYSDSEERVEYFGLVTNQWGDSWPQRVGRIETKGNLQRVVDQYGELVGSQTDGDLSGMRLEDVLDENDQEFLLEFRDILSNTSTWR